jgi:CRISPR-associated endonuclease/helicase Cas3
MDFEISFKALTGNDPFPWQRRLYTDHFCRGNIPSSCNLPTGLGKTSIVAIWLLALANGVSIPRRLVYVVNRRTVVDQTTNEVERYQRVIATSPEFEGFRQTFGDLAISTMRGQFADNGRWCEDPSRPAVICGTVDMIGSRLLFSGYGIGRAARPLHAGFLGQDSLLIHDEAHLEPAFQRLIETIAKTQREREGAVAWPGLQVLELTATSRTADAFGLDQDDEQHPVAQARLAAKKSLHLHSLNDAKKPAKELAERALTLRSSGRSILIFAQSVESVLEIQDILRKAKLPVVTLTGTMRGKERDELVEDAAFARFLPDSGKNVTPGTVYLVCTSAGEVGINISADHLVCDLSTYDSMAQRLGRVNRFGQFDDCEVHVLHPAEKSFDEKHPLTPARMRTLQLFQTLECGGNVGPGDLSKLPETERVEAFAPGPEILPSTEMLFDAWTLTTISGKLPGRPVVEPFLHGQVEYEVPQTRIAWRRDVQILPGDMLGVDDDTRSELLLAYPLLPKELLCEPTERAFRHLQKLGQRHPQHWAWLVSPEGQVVSVLLEFFTDKDNRERLEHCTVVLEPRSGGLSTSGMLDGDIDQPAADVSGTSERCRGDELDGVASGFHEVFRVDVSSDDTDDDASAPPLCWYAQRNTGEIRARRPVLLDVHVADVERRVSEFLSRLNLGESIARCLKLAARYHDAGKRRLMFQFMLGNRQVPTQWWAKSGRQTGRRLAERYRHEFGSLRELPTASSLGISEEERELILHLIAAHHGRARPHFPADEVFDPEVPQAESQEMARSVPQRFGRLQRKYGRWGLAYLESLLRAADWSASAYPSQELEEGL